MLLCRKNKKKDTNRIVVLGLIYTLAVSFTVTAKMQEPLVLHGSTRAVYQICLLKGMPVTYQYLQSKMQSEANDPLQKCVDLLKNLGFRAKKKNLTLSDLGSYDRDVIVMGENEYPIVVQMHNTMYHLIDYPFPPQKLTVAEFSKLWPRQAVVINTVPKIPPNNSGIILQPYAIDFGILDEGEIYQDSFQAKNTSGKPVTITGFKTSCGCACVENVDVIGTIAPHKNKDIKIRFASKDRTGYQQFLYLVQTNKGSVLFKLSGYVRASGVYYPKQLDYGVLCRSEGIKSKTIRFLGYAISGGNPIVSVNAKTPFSYSIKKGINSDWNVIEDHLVVTLDPQKAELGNLDSTIQVKYHKNEKIKVTDIPLSAKIVVAKNKYNVFSIRDAVVGTELTKEFLIPGVDRKNVSGLQKDTRHNDIEVSWNKNDNQCVLIFKATMLESGVAERVIRFTETKDNVNIQHTIYITIISKNRS